MGVGLCPVCVSVHSSGIQGVYFNTPMYVLLTKGLESRSNAPLKPTLRFGIEFTHGG